MGLHPGVKGVNLGIRLCNATLCACFGMYDWSTSTHKARGKVIAIKWKADAAYWTCKLQASTRKTETTRGGAGMHAINSVISALLLASTCSVVCCEYC